ncbi:MAG: four helix bundle protein [Bacteroidales bacterium]|nr:four helix bundle protein [Bacteroidales bacterium]
MSIIDSARDLRVYKLAYQAAMEIFILSKSFPVEEKYDLTSQIRRSSRSVVSNIIEAWRRRRYINTFVYKLNDSKTEADERLFYG